ncbi:apoptosis regulatory protein Siva [Pelodytes ibericus]
MPKRSYPFDGVSPLQLKTRVGEKELCEGVFGEQYKQEIYEKTKKLLFNGAKAVRGNPDQQSEKVPGDCTTQRLLTGQTTIGQDGKLHKITQTQKPLEVDASKACSFCVRSVSDKGACSQCDQAICKTCCMSCFCCAAISCSFCSVIDENDQVFCTSCSLFEL